MERNLPEKLHFKAVIYHTNKKADHLYSNNLNRLQIQARAILNEKNDVAGVDIFDEFEHKKLEGL